MEEEDNTNLDLSKYNPIELSNKELIEDWKVAVHMRCRSDLPDSLSDIHNYTCGILEEIQNRIDSGKLEHEFKPEKMTELSRRVFYLTKQEIEFKQLKAGMGIPMREENKELLEPITLPEVKVFKLLDSNEFKKLKEELFKDG